MTCAEAHPRYSGRRLGTNARMGRSVIACISGVQCGRLPDRSVVSCVPALFAVPQDVGGVSQADR